MSKKDRVKANAKPAKSDAAASLLGTSQAFIGFDTQDSFVLAPEIHAHLKKLSKKDSNTKIKSLQDLTEIIPSNDNLTWVNLIPQWCRFYPKLCTDEDTMVRKNSHLFHTLIVTRTKKDFTPYLKQVAGYWLLSMFDPYSPAAREAKTSFFSTFPDDKWRKVLLFCKTEIFELLTELLNSDVSSLDDDHEKASLKFYRLTSQSLALTVFLLQSEVSGYRESMRSEIIPNLIEKAKFLKLVELPDTAVQKNCVALLTEVIKEDLVSVFDVDAPSGVNLKPLENVALNEMDVSIAEDMWKIISHLEKSKMFCRAAKHEKQWLGKINEVVKNRFEHISFVSNYVLFSSVLEASIKEDWFSCLSNELTLALQDKNTRIPILNEFIQSVFYWLRNEHENAVIDIILGLMNEMCEDPSHVLYASEFCSVTHKYSINHETFGAKVIEFISKCFEELTLENETPVVFLDRFLKLEKTIKRVRIDTTPVSVKKCEKIRKVYFNNLAASEKLISGSFAALDLCITIYEESVSEKERTLKLSTDLFVEMIEKCLQDPIYLSSRSTRICKLAALSDFSANHYEEVFKHISDSKVICQIVTTELQSDKVSLLESEILFNLLSDDSHSSTLKVVYDHLDKMKAERREQYIAALQKVTGDEFFDLSEILLKKLSGSESNTLRKKIYASVLERSTFILDCKLLSLTDSYLSNGTDINELKEFFLFFSAPKSGHSLTKLQTRSLCRKLFNAVKESQREEFSKFCLKTFQEMLIERTKSFKNALQFLFEFNGHMLPGSKLRSRSLNDFALEDFDQYVSFIKDIYQLSLEVTEKVDPSMNKWLADVRMLSNILVPLNADNTVEPTANNEISSIKQTEIFKFISTRTSQGKGDICPKLENSEELPEKDLNALFSEVSLDEINDYLDQISGTKSLLPVTFAKFMRVLMQVMDFLWDGFDLSVHKLEILLLNRQFLHGMESQFRNLNASIGMDKIVELWDTFLCSFVCYGKNIAATSQENLFNNAFYLSYGHVFTNCYTELVTLTKNFKGDEFADILDEWNEVLRTEFEESICTYCIKLIKSDLPDRFFTKRFSEYACLHSTETKTLQKSLTELMGESSYVSYISPALLSRNYKIQTLAAKTLEKCIRGSNDFDLQSVKMLMEVAEMSSVGYELMKSMSDHEDGPPEKIEVADPETHSSVSTFIRANQLVFEYLGKEKPSAVNELLQNEIPHLNYELFLSFLLCLIDYKFDYSNASLFEIPPETVMKDANSLPYLAARCLLSLLIHTPTLCQNWFEKLDRRRRETADYFISKFLSPIIIKRAFTAINLDNSADNSDDRLTIKTFVSERTVRAQYSIEDFAVDVKLSYAKNYPLGRVSIEEIKKKKIGVKDEEWQRLLLDLKISLEQETGSLVNGIIKWKKTLEQIFQGVEECCVCMAVVHPSNRSLPSKPCKVCKKKFHGVCLFTWFEKGTANCPYCRSIF